MDAVIGLDKSNGISGFAKFSVFFVENYKNAKIQKKIWLSRLITACRFHFLKKKKIGLFWGMMMVMMMMMIVMIITIIEIFFWVVKVLKMTPQVTWVRGYYQNDQIFQFSPQGKIRQCIARLSRRTVHRQIRVTLNGRPLNTEIFSKRRKIYSLCSEDLRWYL